MKKLFYLVLLGAVIVSCNKEEDDDVIKDTQNPVIEEFVILNDSVEPGDDLMATFKISDNSALNQAKFEIHEAGGHSHRKASEFEWDMIIDLGGEKTYSDQITVAIPADAEHAEYHFTLLATDKSGNESDLKVIELDIH